MKTRIVNADELTAALDEIGKLTAQRDALLAAVRYIEQQTRPNGDMADQAVNLLLYTAIAAAEKGTP